MYLLHVPIALAFLLPIAAPDSPKTAVKREVTRQLGAQSGLAQDQISLPAKPERLGLPELLRTETAPVQAGPVTRISIGIDPLDWIRRYR